MAGTEPRMEVAAYGNFLKKKHHQNSKAAKVEPTFPLDSVQLFIHLFIFKVVFTSMPYFGFSY